MQATEYDVEQFEHAGLKVTISMEGFVDEFLDPREHDGNLGVMLCGHSRYTLGDEQIDGGDFSPVIECAKCEGTGEDPDAPESPDVGPFQVRRPDCPKCDGLGEITLPLAEYLRREHGARVVLPLGLIDHSGISMYVGSGDHPSDPGGWDSGQVGVIFDTAETRAEFADDISDEEIERLLRAEVEVYDAYLRGEIYHYRVEDEDGELLESCGGFVGDEEYCKEHARNDAEYYARQIEREKVEAAHWAARDTITI